MARITIEDIQEQIKPYGWKVLSTNYKNLDTELVFECDEGHKVYSSWKKLRNKVQCPVCQENIYKSLDNNITATKKAKNVYRVIALDQATHNTGYSIYDNNKLVTYGIFSTKADSEDERIIELRNWVIGLLKSWKPDMIGIEDIQLQNHGYKQGNIYNSDSNGVGIQTYKVLAHLQGVLMITAHDLNIPYKVCPPATWRAHCGVKGKSKADKKCSMQLLAKEWFDISVSDDVADAIGIGKYLANTAKPKPQVMFWE